MPIPLTASLGDLRVPLDGVMRWKILDRLGLLPRYAVVAHPIGDLVVVHSQRLVHLVARFESVEKVATACAVAGIGDPVHGVAPTDRTPPGLSPALRTGRTRRVEVDLEWATPFQRAALEATRGIPVGELRSYAWIAARIGRPRSAHAVGRALAANRAPIAIPCHRVIRSDGSVGDYVLGRAAREQLLEFEGANLDEVARLWRRGVRFVASDTTGIYCTPSCHDARRITSFHRVLLHDAAEARRRGFRPCRSCTPVGTV